MIKKDLKEVLLNDSYIVNHETKLNVLNMQQLEKRLHPFSCPISPITLMSLLKHNQIERCTLGNATSACLWPI